MVAYGEMPVFNQRAAVLQCEPTAPGHWIDAGFHPFGNSRF